MRNAAQEAMVPLAGVHGQPTAKEMDINMENVRSANAFATLSKDKGKQTLC